MNPSLPPVPPDYGLLMPPQPVARALSMVGQDASGRDLLLAPAAAKAWLKMREAAAADGAHLLLLSAFRSIEHQAAIMQRKLEAGVPLAEILRVSAYPGHSEHHTGRAVDIGADGTRSFTEEFEGTAEFAWLQAHAGRFGFFMTYPRGNPHGIAHEPWHWCWTEGQLRGTRDQPSFA